MKDPYQVLGISRGASDEEVKKAYRAQCKRWHPDLNPDDLSAEEHFKDVQAAYDAITKGEANGASPFGGAYGQNPYQQNPYGQRYTQNPYGQQYQRQSSNPNDPFGFGDFGFGGFGGYQNYGQQRPNASYSGSDPAELQQARNCIVNGQYAEARRILNTVERRGARWYYLSALTYQGLGQSINALQDARMACQMEPTNTDYRALLLRLQNPGQAYRRGATTYQTDGGVGNWCFRLILLNLFCNCCLGGGCCRLPFFGRGFYF